MPANDEYRVGVGRCSMHIDDVQCPELLQVFRRTHALELRVQHGDNPEHSRVFSDTILVPYAYGVVPDMLEAKFDPDGPVKAWLVDIHMRLVRNLFPDAVVRLDS